MNKTCFLKYKNVTEINEKTQKLVKFLKFKIKLKTLKTF